MHRAEILLSALLSNKNKENYLWRLTKQAKSKNNVDAVSRIKLWTSHLLSFLTEFPILSDSYRFGKCRSCPPFKRPLTRLGCFLKWLRVSFDNCCFRNANI